MQYCNVLFTSLRYSGTLFTSIRVVIRWPQECVTMQYCSVEQYCIQNCLPLLSFLRRYPVHFHLCGDQLGKSVVHSNLILHSKQRCVVIHATFNTTVENNVAYNTTGEGQYRYTMQCYAILFPCHPIQCIAMLCYVLYDAVLHCNVTGHCHMAEDGKVGNLTLYCQLPCVYTPLLVVRCTSMQATVT